MSELKEYHGSFTGPEVDILLTKVKDGSLTANIDSSLSTESENPVMNKVITEELAKLSAEVGIVYEPINKDVIIVEGGYIARDGLVVNHTDYLYTQPILLKKGETACINTLGASGSVAILSYSDAEGRNLVPIIISDESVRKKYYYTAIEDIYIVGSGVIIEWEILFFQSSDMGIIPNLYRIKEDYKKNFATIAANRVKFVDGIYVTAYGQTSNIAFDSIDYLEIAEYDEFNFTNLIDPIDEGPRVCFYDKDKSIVSSVGQSTLNVGGISKTIAPQGAKYVRCSIRASERLGFYCFISKGDSPKNEDSQLDILSHDPQSNYVSGFVADTYIDGEGKETKYKGFYSTKEVYLLPNTPYYHAGFYAGYYAFYDKDGKVVESYGFDAEKIPNPFYVPDNTHYARFTCTSEASKESAWVFTENREPVPYKEVVSEEYLPSNLQEKTHCNFEGEEIGVFHRGICIGDSLTEGTMNYVNSNGGQSYITIREKSYPQYLTKLTGIDIDNFGHGGATSFEWYALEKDTDLSGYDFAIIQLGVNDAYRNDTNYGTVWSDDSQQGFLSIVNKLQNENKGIKIFVSTIIPAMSYASQSMIDMCQYIRDFVANLNDKNVILLDMQIYGNTKDAEAYNCGHLSALGYWRLAKDYQGIISYYISKHMDEFREVQFIGTDYKYVL